MTTVQPRSIQNLRPFRSYAADFILVGLLSGPIAAPFLASSGLPILPLISDIIYAMGRLVCPQPEMGLMLSEPNIMAVCMRCYGTLMGVVLMRYLVQRSGGQERYWLHQYGLLGLMACILLCLVYPAELYAQIWGWWSYNNWVVTVFGLISGIGLGAHIMPWLHPQGRLSGFRGRG